MTTPRRSFLVFGAAVANDGTLFVAGGFDPQLQIDNDTDALVDGTDAFAADSILSDIFVLKFNSANSKIWSARAGGEEDDLGTAVAITSNGAPTVVGTYTDLAAFGPSLDECEEDASYPGCLISVGASTDAFAGQIDPDGGWQEGGGYWFYGTHTSVYFAEAMKRLTGGKYNLFEHPRLKNNTVNFPVYCFLPPKKTVDFEDSGGGIIGKSHFYNKLATETGSREASWYRKTMFGAGDDPFDIVWPRSTVPAEPPKRPSIHFRGIDWVIMRSDFADPAKVVVAAKAGQNDDPHHGHLDIGHFILQWNGQGFIAESGHSAYDEKFFDEARYEYPQASSVGHNVIFVNGEKLESPRLTGHRIPFMEATKFGVKVSAGNVGQ